MQISQLVVCQKGYVIQEPVHATVKHVFGFQQGTGQFGPWTRIDGILEDASGEIPWSWWEPLTQDANSIVGAQVSLCAYPTQQHGLVGCTVDEYIKKDQDTKQPIIDPATGQPMLVKKIKSRGRAVTMLSALTNTPAPQPAAQFSTQTSIPQTVPQATTQTSVQPQAVGKPTDDDILDALPKWVARIDAVLNQATTSEGEAARIKAIVSFAITMSINTAEGKIRLAMPAQQTSAPAAQPGAPMAQPQAQGVQPLDEDIPF